MDLSTLKGTQDYLPEDQILRARIVGVLTRAFERYGFSPCETPILNHFEVLASKYSGGAEILRETYSLRDQGERHLGLRYDLTVPFSRLVGKQERALPLPFKRYEIGRVFRNGPVKTGRLREFTQCDVDVVGSHSMISDAELVAMAFEVFDELGLAAVCELNNRKLLSGIIEAVGVPHALVGTVILSVDKLKKIGAEGVFAELAEKDVARDLAERLIEYCDAIEARLADRPAARWLDEDWPRGYLRHGLIDEGLGELRALHEHLAAMDVPLARVRVVPSLARGLEIYTGTVFEFFLPESPITSSVAAGGRYDRIIGAFLANAKREGEEDVDLDKIPDYPACGISFGLDVVFQVLRAAGAEVDQRRSVARACVVPVGETAGAVRVARSLRRAGVPTEILAEPRKLKKALAYVDKLRIPYAVLVGEDELARGVVKIRDMAGGAEAEVPIDAAARHLANGRAAGGEERK